MMNPLPRLALVLLFLFSGISGTVADEEAILTIARHPSYFGNYTTPLTQRPKLLLRFNAPVAAEALEQHLHFRSHRGEELPAHVTRPTAEEVAPLQSSDESAAFPMEHFFVVEPMSPLMLDHRWTLAADAALTSASESHRLDQDWNSRIGTIYPFELDPPVAEVPYDGPRSLRLSLNKSLHERFTPETLGAYVEIHPEPENFRISRSARDIVLHGAFENREYRVIVSPGLVAFDDTATTEPINEPVAFAPNPGFLSLPATSVSQNAAGSGEFELMTGNLRSIQLRVKNLAGPNLIHALRGYEDAYTGSGERRTIPFSMVPGSTIHDEEIRPAGEVDHSEKIALDWSELLGREKPRAAVYLCAEGLSRTRNSFRVGGQAIIQLTDIGLAWKQTEHGTSVFAFSHETGKPLADAAVTLYDDEAEPLLESTTDHDGIASLVHGEETAKANLWLEARLGEDRHVIRFSETLDQIGLWNFGVPHRYRYRHSQNDAAATTDRRVLLFTDRDIYKPGERVNLMAISRLTDFDKLLPADAQEREVQLVVRDARGRQFLTRDLKLSENGSLDAAFDLPGGAPVQGSYRIELRFDPEFQEGNRIWRNSRSHYITVADYRPNTFTLEIPQEKILHDPSTGHVTAQVNAAYYMGKPISKAQLTWHAYSSKAYPTSEAYADFRFGPIEANFNSLSQQSSVLLHDDGTGEIAFEVPENEIPTPARITINAEITVLNQQTIVQTASFTAHASDFYLGFKNPEGILRANQPLELETAALDPVGERWESAVDARLKIERVSFNTVKIKGAGGKITTRNERLLDFYSEEAVQFRTREHEGTGVDLPARIPVTIDAPGDYIATLTSEDSQGRLVQTSTRLTIFGASEPNWSHGDTLRIPLNTDRDRYAVGDTAKLLVRSPILGHALVTLERAGVRRIFTHEITEPETEIELPILEGDAPNLFASVLIIRGSADSPHQHPNTDYRLGYRSIEVEDPATDLKLTIDTPADYVLPGKPITLVANTLPGTEVMLYAVDEGVLSLTGYETPDPHAVFHASYPLRVSTGQTISELFAEIPQERQFANKGYVIGGGMVKGSVGGDDPLRARKHFKALAHWSGTLISDAEGRVSTTFNAPDNLTTFRVMAIAGNGDAFASAESKVIVNKPLVIEPALPAFSNVGDHLDLSAILHNNTEDDLKLKVRLELDERASLIESAITRPALTSLDETELLLRAGETNRVAFPVEFTGVGEAQWTWSAIAEEASLADVTESTLSVGYPVPLLRETGVARLENRESVENILSEISPALLNGAGEIRLSLSNSRAIEALDSLDYLLRYPYGCVEQTTSSTLPWLSTQNLREALPNLQKSDEEIAGAIRAGTARILSMQTHDGGLGYWPGATEATFRASAYGGLALALAERQGFALPADRLNAIWSYLSNELRDTANVENKNELSNRCLALYTLSLAGRSEPAYHELIYQRHDELPTHARSLLALAMMESAVDPPAAIQERIGKLLETPEPRDLPNDPWYSRSYAHSANLLALAQHDPSSPDTDQLIDKMFASQTARPNTYTSAWQLLGLAKYTETKGHLGGLGEVVVTFGDETKTITFDKEHPSHQIAFPFTGDLRSRPLTVDLAGLEGRIFSHSEVATQPVWENFAPVNKGFTIDRRYQRVEADGSVFPAERLAVGDLVLITLDIDTPPGTQHYLAVDDPLPSIFEAIHPEIESRNQTAVEQEETDRRRLYTNHTELREDRALFFCDYLYRGGEYRVQYLARVVAPGEATAPPAKVEAMYSPEIYGLSATERITAQPLNLDKGEVAQH